MGGGGSAPQPLTIGTQVGQTLGAEGQTQAANFSNAQTYQPLFTGLQTQSLQDFLMGGNGSGGGYLSTLTAAQPQVSGIQNAATTSASLANINNLLDMGPQALTAVRSANPQMANLLDALNQQTISQVNAGSTIDPEMATNLQQQFRGALAARGLGTGTGDAGLEAYMMQMQGNNLRTQRFQQGSTMAQLLNGAYGGLVTSLATGGQPANVAGYGTTALGTLGGALQPMTFDPMNSYAGNYYDTSLNAATSAYNSNQNNKAAITGALIGAGSKIAGGFI